jgi:nucleotide-binding universal stress UspA family protein
MVDDNDHQLTSFTIKKILVPFDNSSHASRAFGHALDLAKKFGASIIVISVIQEEFKKSWVNDTPTREKNMSRKSRTKLREGIKELQNQAQKISIRIEQEILTSRNIAESIISFISSKKIDYVVMGTRGKGMQKEMMLGRVSTSVALNANCPVVLVK